MSPRRSSLSLNQKLTLLLVFLGIVASIVVAFISGHDWFAKESTITPSPTSNLHPSPIEDLPTSTPETLRVSYGILYYYPFVEGGRKWITGPTYTYYLSVTGCEEDNNNFTSDPISFTVTSQPGEEFFLLKFGIFNRIDTNDSTARAVNEPSEIPPSYAIVIIPIDDTDKLSSVLRSCSVTMLLYINDASTPIKLSLSPSPDGILHSNEDGVFQMEPEFFLQLP